MPSSSPARKRLLEPRHGSWHLPIAQAARLQRSSLPCGSAGRNGLPGQALKFSAEIPISGAQGGRLTAFRGSSVFRGSRDCSNCSLELFRFLQDARLQHSSVPCNLRLGAEHVLPDESGRKIQKRRLNKLSAIEEDQSAEPAIAQGSDHRGSDQKKRKTSALLQELSNITFEHTPTLP